MNLRNDVIEMVARMKVPKVRSTFRKYVPFHDIILTNLYVDGCRPKFLLRTSGVVVKKMYHR